MPDLALTATVVHVSAAAALWRILGQRLAAGAALEHLLLDSVRIVAREWLQPMWQLKRWLRGMFSRKC